VQQYVEGVSSVY